MSGTSPTSSMCKLRCMLTYHFYTQLQDHSPVQNGGCSSHTPGAQRMGSPSTHQIVGWMTCWSPPNALSMSSQPFFQEQEAEGFLEWGLLEWSVHIQATTTYWCHNLVRTLLQLITSSKNKPMVHESHRIIPGRYYTLLPSPCGCISCTFHAVRRPCQRAALPQSLHMAIIVHGVSVQRRSVTTNMTQIHFWIREMSILQRSRGWNSPV